LDRNARVRPPQRHENWCPDLMILVAATADVPVPDRGAAGVEVWRDVDGVLAALGFRAGDDHCVHVPNVGTFAFTAASDEIRLSADPTAPESLRVDAFQRIAVPLALQLRGLQVLHASAVVVDGGVVALCGRSGAGKSTLAYGLGRRGFPLWGDDAVAFEPRAGGLLASPLPFRMRLRPASAEWFDDLAHQKGFEQDTPWESEPSPARFTALFVLERRTTASPDEKPEIVRLAPADAFSAVLPHAYYLALDDEELNRELLTTYLTLSEELPVFALRYTPRLDLVEDITALVTATARAL
jgi:hypothetical protein